MCVICNGSTVVFKCLKFGLAIAPCPECNAPKIDINSINYHPGQSILVTEAAR